jgi:hypothetical protein
MERCDFREATHCKIRGEVFKIISKWGINPNKTLRSAKRGGFGVIVETTIGRIEAEYKIGMMDIEAYYKESKPIPKPLTDVEMEIIRADMAFLIQKEKESGDWDKWKKAQKRLGWVPEEDRAERRINRQMSFRMLMDAPTSVITREKFIASVGREPISDDLDRCNCTEAGLLGHTSCGWCLNCDKPRFMCRCQHLLGN